MGFFQNIFGNNTCQDQTQPDRLLGNLVACSRYTETVIQSRFPQNTTANNSLFLLYYTHKGNASPASIDQGLPKEMSFAGSSRLLGVELLANETAHL